MPDLGPRFARSNIYSICGTKKLWHIIVEKREYSGLDVCMTCVKNKTQQTFFALAVFTECNADAHARLSYSDSCILLCMA